VDIIIVVVVVVAAVGEREVVTVVQL